MHAIELGLLEDALASVGDVQRVLEVGCGTGRLAMELRKRGVSVDGVDRSADMLEKFRQKLRPDGPRCELTLASADDLPHPDGAYDFVYAIRLLNQTGSRDVALGTIDQMLRVARPGGAVLLEFANHYRPRGHGKTVLFNPDHLLRYVETKDARPIWLKGAFFLGMTSYYRAPDWVAPSLRRVDKVLSFAMPKLSSRGYLLVEKTSLERR